MDRRSGTAENLLEFFAPQLERHFAQVVIAQREKVPRHERRRRFLCQHFHARRGRMDAQQQRFEIESVRADNHDLAIDD